MANLNVTARVILPLAVYASIVSAQQTPSPLDRYLRTTIGLTPAQIDDANRGRAVSKILPTDSNRDVTVFGIVGVHMTRAEYVARIRDLPRLIASRSAKFGIMGDPITPADVQGVAVDPSEYKDLRECKPNDCNFKLPAPEMRRLAQTVDWKGSDPKAQVDALVRQDVTQFVTQYRAVGNAAMVRFDDNGGVLASDAFGALLDQTPLMRDYAPELRDYLVSYPSKRPNHIVEALYWSDDRLPRLRPTFTINHLVVYTPDTGAPLVALKQIYADHYFEAGFQMLAAFDAPSLSGGPGMYLIGLRRYRFDNLPGGILNIRGRVRDAMADLIRADLERERVANERK